MVLRPWLAEASDAKRDQHDARVRPPATSLVTCNDRDEAAEAIQHREGDQDSHRVAQLEEDERRHRNAGRNNIATPDEGRAATISGERKVEEEQGKAPEGEGGPTAMAAEVDLGIAITQFKVFVVTIHT